AFNNCWNGVCGGWLTLRSWGSQEDDVEASICWSDLKISTLPCGNGALDEGEVCDDGNLLDGDACPSDCQSIGEPLAHYDMEDSDGATIANKSPRYPGAFTGTLLNQAHVAQDSNPSGGSHLELDGSQDVLELNQGWEQGGEDVWLTSRMFSLSAWVRFNTLPEAVGGAEATARRDVVSLGHSATLTASPMATAFGEGGWSFYLFDASKCGSATCKVGVSTGLEHPTYVTDQWVHLVGTYDGDWMRLHVNGEEVASEQVGTIALTYWNDDNTYYGTQSYLGGAVFNNIVVIGMDGAMDEVSLWDVALSADLVADLYNDGVPASATGLGAEPICGDGVIQPGEQCEDGNDVSVDGCEP
ncbi:MAG: LamG-like jellyroll fold domain-containing protein, partial [Myxococcota bacterium]|nr:LamG-like jellyroll fold domain-containing protein [Myxococcota bacterium]